MHNRQSDSRPSRQTWVHWGVLWCTLLAVVAYHMPWQTHKVAAFTHNAFDLAEFASLHPTVRAENPALLTSLLLRLPLILLPLLMALTASRLESEKGRWLWRGLALLVVLRLNPPEVFYPWGGGSVNDRQLGFMMVAGLAAVLAVMVIGRWLRPLWPLLMVGLWGLTAGVALAGYNRAEDIMRLLQLDTHVGAGLAAFVGVAILAIGLVVWSLGVPRLLARRAPTAPIAR